MPIQPGTNKTGISGQLGKVKLATAYYDFAVDGGAVGAITLRCDQAIPSGAFILDSFINVQTVVTSGGAATVSIGTEAATDLRAAATLSTAPALDSATPKRLAVTGATAPVKTTASRNIVATIAVAALTAGKFTVTVSYVEVA